MIVVIPIRTESVAHRPPLVNYLLIGVNLFMFVALNPAFGGPAIQAWKSEHLYFHSQAPALYQFLTYQFFHADAWHLFGNMLFLWVFGNSVNGKMGHVPYLLFYLAGGMFAAWGYAQISADAFELVGASGAIAAVTTAYLALFPRSHVTVLVWLFLFIHFFEWPAMIIIGAKIIVWDNIIGPMIEGGGAVAYGAHLAGYLFGFVASLIMLFLRALPRDQFDILALWKRWNQRRELAAVLANPAAAAAAQFGSVARVKPLSPQARVAAERQLDEISELRGKISERLEHHDAPAAAILYEQLMLKDPRQCLSERQQLAVAREFYGTARFPQAAAAFDRFVECYARSSELANVKLLLGIIYARDLAQFEAADKHLSESFEALRDDERRSQCLQWLQNVRSALGRPAPES